MALALSILWILCTLLIMWGASIMWRGLWPRGRVRRGLWCPSCGTKVDGLSCSSCKYEGQSEKDFRLSRDWRLFSCGWIPVIGGVASGYGAEVVRGWFGDSLAKGDVSLGPAQGGAIGVAIFAVVLAVWSYRGDRAKGRRRCPKCWYDMSASELMCPECGHDAKVVKRLYRPRRRMRGVVGGLVLLLASYGVWVAPRVIKGGPVGAIPSWVLIVGLESLPDGVMVPTPSQQGSEDWTLHGRWQHNRLWGVERWLLKIRARYLVEHGASARVIQRIMPMLDVRDQDLAVQSHISIVKGLISESASERTAAANTYVWFGVDENVTRAIGQHSDKLFKALEDPAPAVQAHAAWYLAEINTDPRRLLKRIFELIRATPASFMMFRGVLSDPKFGANQAAAMIIEASRDPDPLLRVACVSFLARVNRHDGLMRLTEMLKDSDTRVSQAAADAMATLVEDADRVVPALVSWWVQQPRVANRFPDIAQYGERLGPHMELIGKLAEADNAVGMLIADWLTRIRANVNYAPLVLVLQAIEKGVDQKNADEARRLLEAIESINARPE